MRQLGRLLVASYRLRADDRFGGYCYGLRPALAPVAYQRQSASYGALRRLVRSVDFFDNAVGMLEPAAVGMAEEPQRFRWRA